MRIGKKIQLINELYGFDQPELDAEMTWEKKPSKDMLKKIKLGVCEYCKEVCHDLTIDHIIPKSKGGTSHQQNLQLLCAPCNHLKGSLEEDGTAIKEANCVIHGKRMHFFYPAASANSANSMSSEQFAWFLRHYPIKKRVYVCFSCAKDGYKKI
jgi:hypothetical protein